MCFKGTLTPLLSFPSAVPFPSLLAVVPPPPLLSYFLPLPLELGPVLRLGGPGERSSSPTWSGRSPAAKRFW